MKHIDGEKLVKALRAKAVKTRRESHNWKNDATQLAYETKASAIADIADAIESSLTSEEGEKVET